MAPLMEVRDLAGYFETYEGPVRALNGVDLRLERGQVTGLVGETGSGKSATVNLMVGVAAPNFRVTRGELLFDGIDLLKLSDKEMRPIRGKRISIAFQDPRSSLNPVITVGEQLARVARQHHGVSWPEARRMAIEMLERVQISEPERRVRQYPHEMSGGMAQRVLIAMALMPAPELLILDEPTTGLDVTVQAEILDLLRSRVRESGLTALIISHDLAVVAEICDVVSVMYAGWIVEHGAAQQVLEAPSHPYTVELARAARSVDSARTRGKDETAPELAPSSTGCLFLNRCPLRTTACEVEPPLIRVDSGHLSKCHFAARVHEAGAVQAGAGT
jgi:oligopeptide/dipeptide ABC transporter ATP-binding protein